jgi:hypothetical protein
MGAECTNGDCMGVFVCFGGLARDFSVLVFVGLLALHEINRRIFGVAKV